MAVKGRKPKPTHLRVVTGNAGKRAINKSEPKPVLNIPEPPPILDQIALDEWNRLSVKLFKMGILSDLDMSALVGYCVAYSTFSRAQRELNLSELVVETPNGAFQPNAVLGVRNKAAELMLKFAAEFGMTPSARSRITAAEQKNDDPAESYFG